MLKRTALYDEHVLLKGRIVDFGGWELPVQYSGVLNEHTAVRNHAGLFDVSHMGEIQIEGPSAKDFVNYLITNDVNKIAVGQAQYSAMCNESGGIIDDLVIYRTAEQKYLLVVNASNKDKDFAHIQSVWATCPLQKPTLKDLSSEYSQIALQGPKSEMILQKLTATDLSKIGTYCCAEGEIKTETGSVPALFARTGYTGEDGFELYIPWASAPQVWLALLTIGASDGLIPCGLGARDTLRLEMKYALYGHELTEDTHPLETGLGWVTKLTKENFIGKDALILAKTKGIQRSLVGVQSLGKGIPRQGYPVYSMPQANQDSQLIGTITSGTSSPSTKLPIGVALIQKTHEAVGTKLRVKIREDFVDFEVVKTPFYQKTNQNQ
jgi:aminomethyltransferase